jgi:phosphohistidine phosphatase
VDSLLSAHGKGTRGQGDLAKRSRCNAGVHGARRAFFPQPADGADRIEVVIWLLRHGDAESGEDDDARGLTAKGESQAESAGRALAALGIRPDACLCSPKVRALDTARIACRSLGVDPEPTEALAGDGFDPAVLGAGLGEVLMVGHDPDFSRAIAQATGARVKMKKGGLAAIEDGTLITLLRPEQIALIGGGP